MRERPIVDLANPARRAARLQDRACGTDQCSNSHNLSCAAHERLGDILTVARENTRLSPQNLSSCAAGNLRRRPRSGQASELLGADRHQPKPIPQRHNLWTQTVPSIEPALHATEAGAHEQHRRFTICGHGPPD